MDTLSKSKRSEVMSHIHSRGNKSTELKLIALFRHKHISGWRRNSKLIGKPDFIFPKFKLVVFVDGCFWHGCKCEKGRLPQTNRSFWKDKIMKNRARDREVSIVLKNKGFKVIRIRECQLKKNPMRQLSRVLKVINKM